MFNPKTHSRDHKTCAVHEWEDIPSTVLSRSHSRQVIHQRQWCLALKVTTKTYDKEDKGYVIAQATGTDTQIIEPWIYE